MSGKNNLFQHAMLQQSIMIKKDKIFYLLKI